MPLVGRLVIVARQCDGTGADTSIVLRKARRRKRRMPLSVTAFEYINNQSSRKHSGSIFNNINYLISIQTITILLTIRHPVRQPDSESHRLQHAVPYRPSRSRGKLRPRPRCSRRRHTGHCRHVSSRSLPLKPTEELTHHLVFDTMPSDKEVNSAQSGDEDTVIAEGKNPLCSLPLSYRTVATGWLTS